ncbi:DNA helicase IV [Actinopolymorpha cephalotaxi]|uniref:DNA helicase IV n=1 Tax=Actinopolymorpha cephalotaxi TaxID=504797 RepID=A0A1I3A3X8_9ACTN|nr:UvrD-helicase domain-containing protein [Actinopolymorpha cephalotaxi]NYH85372.1 DNA helicase IV [Actinopolymorpha cephalotaxi]SFH44459.1 DNA helicase IV [Actinopolymorpha cephalotaxi]
MDSSELRLEQTYFDRAWGERERKREVLRSAPMAAAGPISGTALIKRAAERAIEALGAPGDSVAFGRFDDSAGDTYYIGRHLINTEDRDCLVINWQSPAAMPYYKATHDDPCDVRLKRSFNTHANKVLNYEDMLFADLAQRVEELSGSERWGIDDTVLRDLDAHRTGEMRDIVQTIHAAQYELIRSPLEQLLIIQGGPGTGKTAIALHRVSWLLYNHQGKVAPSDVLVVGPNPTFTRYIRSVLPGLGDADVEHRDLSSLGPQASTGRSEDPEVTRLKGEARMGRLLTRALQQRVRFPERSDVLDIGRGVGAPRLGRNAIQSVLPRFLAATTYNDGRGQFRAWLSERVQRGRLSTVALSAGSLDAAVERVWPSLTPQSFLRDLLGSRERLVAAAGDDFTAGDIGRLLRTPAERISEERWSDADVALLDQADYMISGRFPTFHHIVIDEAQDLSPMQLQSVRLRSRTGSLTVVGDLAQSTGPWARDSWADIEETLVRRHPSKVEELTLGYRVPEQVYALAARLLPIAAPEIVPPRVVRRGPADPELTQVEPEDVAGQAVVTAREYAGRGLFVGIVCPDDVREDVEDSLRRAGVAYSDVGSGKLGASINLARPVEAKGLEFDAVVVVEPESIVAEYERGHRMLYVALTRTTRYLSVVFSRTALALPVDSAGGATPVADVPVIRTVEEPPEESPTPTRRRPEVDTGPSRVRTDHSSKDGVGSDIADTVSQAVAVTIAAHIRHSVGEPLWADVIDRIRLELGVSQEDLFDRFE